MCFRQENVCLGQKNIQIAIYEQGAQVVILEDKQLYYCGSACAAIIEHVKQQKSTDAEEILNKLYHCRIRQC